MDKIESTRDFGICGLHVKITEVPEVNIYVLAQIGPFQDSDLGHLMKHVN